MCDTVGKVQGIILPAHYAPQACQHLLSSTTVFCNQIQINLLNTPSIFWLIQITTSQWYSMSLISESQSISIELLWICYYYTCIKFQSIQTAQRTSLMALLSLGHIGLRTVQFILCTGALATLHTLCTPKKLIFVHKINGKKGHSILANMLQRIFALFITLTKLLCGLWTNTRVSSYYSLLLLYYRMYNSESIILKIIVYSYHFSIHWWWWFCATDLMVKYLLVVPIPLKIIWKFTWAVLSTKINDS